MQKRHPDGFFVALDRGTAAPYRLRVKLADGAWTELEDPYRFPLLLSEFELHLHGEGTHYESYNTLGAHLVEQDGVEGVRFAVWAPNAEVVCRDRGLQRLGHAPSSDAPARRRRLGDLPARRRRGRHVQVLRPLARTWAPADEGGPVRLPVGDAAGLRFRRLPAGQTSVGRRRLDGGTRAGATC